MDTTLLDQIAAKLDESHLPEVSRATGLPYNTLKNVREKRNVTWLTLEKLAAYFKGLDV